MTNSDSKLVILNKLRHKAELSRYAHSQLKEKKQIFYRWKKFFAVFLSAILALVIGIYYRNLISGDWVLVTMLTIPILSVSLETLDNTLFRWEEGITKHEFAVQIWGSWIREVDYFQEFALSNEEFASDEEMEKLQQKYIDCMDRVHQIPNKNFLKYKVEYRIKRIKSQKIDGMDLKELQTTQIWKNQCE